MGSCVPKKSSKMFQIQSMPQEVLCHYPRSAEIKVNFKNYIGRIIKEQMISFELTEPELIQTEMLLINNTKLKASLCILPGLETRQRTRVTCQDDAFYLHDEQSLFLVLMDGHGKEGEKVVKFCHALIENLYKTEKDLQRVMNIQQDPFKFFALITETCDKALNNPNNDFSSTLSGAAGVFVYVTQDCIYSGSVGDSRAILGTQKLPKVLPVPQSGTADKNILEEVRQRRSSNPENEIWPLQLTKDQKPNDKEEKINILKAGGRVQRIVDEFGKAVGPYRVWDKTGNFPGLAMSRSIGDLAAKRLGVISTPICTKHVINNDFDFFLVVASDGIWEVMENEDVANFVECFRKSCKEGQRENGDEVNLLTSCISQLLAEEARVRWYSIVAEEDVKIDDISCIVVEMNFSDKVAKKVRMNNPLKRTVKTVAEEISSDYCRAPSMKEIVIRDPKRGSVVEGDD